MPKGEALISEAEQQPTDDTNLRIGEGSVSMTDTPIERVARAIWEAESLPIIDDDFEAW